MYPLGFIGGLCTSSAMVPQLYHMISTKSAKDFSWGMLMLSSVGQSFWIAHAIQIMDPAVILFASISLCVNGTFAVIKISTSEELQESGKWWVKWCTIGCLVREKDKEMLPLSQHPTIKN